MSEAEEKRHDHDHDYDHDHDHDHDRGGSMAHQRTRLAWLRTALASTVVSLLAVRLAVGPRLTPGGALGLASAAGLWLAVVVICYRRLQSLSRLRALSGPRPVGADRSSAALAATVVGYALLGALIVGLRRG